MARKKYKPLDQDSVWNIRTRNMTTGKVTNNEIPIPAGDDPIMNVRQNEKGTLVTSPIMKLFVGFTKIWKPKGGEFERVDEE